MQVDPTRLVELAATSEGILGAMVKDWQAAVEELDQACVGLGDATGTLNIAASYADSLADAGEVVTALVQALDLGITGLVDAAQDAVRADDTVAAELARTNHLLAEGLGPTRGCGGR
ncbi:hypothetical protein [Nocardioides baculatus]|uniref:WXG100 family type VII secretion target n=1 Tax=Nocardioides baculatus TaxID=2801337 RepID=A0ABS1L5S7_9ACTN|nr:hypothetical protein [Nocardioides baculatus]MBL0747040.1 hypothetical protein [Nocardioides baculatus]